MRLPVNGELEYRWVLTVGYLSDGPESPTGTRYYLGDFDGRRFRILDGSVGLPVDAGPDFYAAQAWSHANPVTWTGWLGNWAYARSIPASRWRGSLAIARHIDLVRVGDLYRLRQRPVLAPRPTSGADRQRARPRAPVANGWPLEVARRHDDRPEARRLRARHARSRSGGGRTRF
jgi:sucrose-6-phosphate hydrolase SacC (GH32 family)